MKAILSAPPRTGNADWAGVAVSVGATSVAVASTIGMTGSVTSITSVSVATEADVAVLATGASVSDGPLNAFTTKKPPARSAMATIGRMITSGLNALFGAATSATSAFLLITVPFATGGAIFVFTTVALELVVEMVAVRPAS